MVDQSEADSGTIESQPSFVDDIQQLFGSDFEPDPIFLEESWTLGMPAALENLHRRRQAQAGSEHLFRELNSAETVLFVENSEGAAETLLANRAATIASRYESTWTRHNAQAVAAQTRNTQQSRTAEQPQTGTAQEAEPVAPPRDRMDVAHARQLFGVTAESTREQIRSGYRRMVRRWHPDHLQGASAEVREQATQMMATINEAFRLLCPTEQR
jgi:DnaJ-domain-containing protein 1